MKNSEFRMQESGATHSGPATERLSVASDSWPLTPNFCLLTPVS
jgi:hypothetical protein